jgi:hypothetical protein
MKEQWLRFEEHEKERETRIAMQRRIKEHKDLDGCTFSPSIIKTVRNDSGDN